MIPLDCLSRKRNVLCALSDGNKSVISLKCVILVVFVAAENSFMEITIAMILRRFSEK